MRKLVVVGWLAMVTTVAQAQWQPANKTVVCGDTAQLLAEISTGKWQELPVWFGEEEASQSRYSLFVNLTSQTWTLIQSKDRLGCVLGGGKNSNLLVERPAP